MTYYYGDYHRRYYKCKACGKQSWADVCSTYGTETNRDNHEHQMGHHHRQNRGMYDLCQYHYTIDLRAMKVLRDAGYTHVGRDGVMFEERTGNGPIFSMIVWFIEPKKEQ
jgi:hypothetical protein